MAPVKRRQWYPEAIAAAIAEVKFGRLSIHKASKMYQIPKSTLHDHVIGKVLEGASNGKPPVLSAADEQYLVKHHQKEQGWAIVLGKQFLNVLPEP